jgi:hypothetical protein
MKNTLIVVTDLACFKAFRVDDDSLHSRPRLELLEQFHTTANQRLVDQVTDQAGRFPGAAAGPMMAGMSQGERHNIGLEQRRRGVRKLATKVNSLMRDPEVEQYFLAASREINTPLLEQLEPRVRSKLKINVPADLTKIAASELLDYFKATA